MIPRFGERMAASIVDSSVVYRDLRDAHADLAKAQDSPRDVRRCFSRYVDLSQRLTSAMRKDFGRLGRKWVAGGFSGWSSVTQLLKHLRNEEQHNNQIFLHAHELRHFRLPEDIEVVGMGREFQMTNTWLLSDQLLDSPPQGLLVSLIDPSTGRPEPSVELQPFRITRRYVIAPRDDETKKLLERCGTSDVRELADAASQTYRKYYEYFIGQAGA